MFKFLMAAVLMLAGLVLSAAEGKNLLVNSDFRIHDGVYVDSWVCPQVPYSEYHETGGPDGRPYIAILPGPDAEFETKLREKFLTLVPGEKYRLGATIRTKGFTAKRANLLVVDDGWYNEVGIETLPENTDGWQKIQMVVTCPESKDTSRYDVLLFTLAQKGQLDIADMECVPLTDKAIAGSRPTQLGSLMQVPRLIPWAPSFHDVPSWNPVISFIWYGVAAPGFRAEDYRADAVAANQPGFRSAGVVFEPGKPFSLNLKGLPEGLHKVTVRLVKAGTEDIAFSETFHVSIRPLPRPEEVTAGTRLNNFTVELVNRTMPANGRVSFTVAHDCWMYFTVKSPSSAAFAMTLDGVKIADPVTGLPEAFRFVEAGTHSFSADCAGTFIVRTVAEMFSCAMLDGSRVASMPKFDWDYARKWAMKAITTCNRGMSQKELPDILSLCHASGRIWTDNLNAVQIPSAEVMTKRVNERISKLKNLDGVTADELGYYNADLDYYTQGLKHAEYNRDKLIYTWICFAPYIQFLHRDFIGTSFNASRGRGKLLFESYRVTKPTEQEAMEYLESTMVKHITESCRMYPDYSRRAGVIMGNFNQLNVITLEHHPEVDYKYYLDMQVHLLATHPAFMGLGMVGYWGTHYADEEMYRWSHQLLRHYVVEGHTEMLSRKYGFAYRPGHTVNGDFTDGLNGWTVEPAKDGSIAVEHVFDYGRRNQNRYGDDPKHYGDWVCAMTRAADRPNRISQVARNLVPGKPYVLQFSAGDFNDLKAQKFNPRRVGMDAIISDADISPDSFVDVDRRELGNYKFNNRIARQNLHRIIFKPKKPQVTITVTDEKAAPGETLMFNFFQVKPFFPKESAEN